MVRDFGAALVLLAWATMQMTAQSPATQPAPSGQRLAFDAASIKLHTSGPNSGLNLARPGGHVELTASLPVLMILAYNFPSLSEAMNRIIGIPNWGISETFDVEAEAPGNPTVEQKRLMLQSLLADRFKMTVHHETRQLPVYALELVKAGKLGPQLHADAADTACDRAGTEESSSAKDGSPAAIALQDLQQFPCGRVVGGFLLPGDHVQVWSGGRNVSMGTIAGGIGGMEYIDHPVVNRTGLAGDFDFTVEWDSRTATEDLSAGPAPLARGPVSTEPVGNSLLEAMRDQLGLRLELQKGQVDVIVIDHVQQPTQN